MFEFFTAAIILALGILLMRYLAVTRMHRHTNRCAHNIVKKDVGIHQINKERHAAFENRASRLLALFKDKEMISNDDAQQILEVSDATATRYLDELERKGKIEQVGRMGRGVKYKLRK